MEKEKKEKIKKIVFNVMVFFCVFLFSIAIVSKKLQNDTFYNIKIGEYIMHNGISDLTKDIFSWHNLPYTYPHWLYDLGMYIIYNSFGQKGIYYSTIILTAMLGASIYLTSNKVSKNNVVSFVLTIASMYLLKSYIAARAQLVTFVLFSLTVYFIEMFLETHKKRYCIPLFIIPILITNLHSAVFPFYFILFLPYIAEYLLVSVVDLYLDYRFIFLLFKIRRKFTKKENKKEKYTLKIEKVKQIIEDKKVKKEQRRSNPYKIKVQKNSYVKWLIVIVLLTAFTGFLNPTGTTAYTYTYKTLKGNTTQSINEHLPMTIMDNKEFIFAMCMFLGILIFTDTKIKLSDLFMLGGLTALALMSRRQVSMFAIFCTPILVKLISDMFKKYDNKTCKKIFNFSTTFLGVLIICVSFSIYSMEKIKKMIKTDENYVDKSEYPVEAADWMLENLDVKTIKLYNEYNYGSYLLFRDIPVFIDSRADVYDPVFNGGRDIFSDALNIAAISLDFNKKFDEYGVTHVIAYSNSKLVMLMKKDIHYKKLYEDDHFSIYERLK